MSAKNTEDPSAQRELMSRSLGSAVFPFESSAEAHFHQEVLLAAQRWISAHGWPGGPFPVTVPQTLRWWVVASCFILPGGVEQISIFLQLIDAFLITYALHSFRSYFRIISFELCHSFQSRHPYPIRWWWHRCECEEGSYGERKRRKRNNGRMGYQPEKGCQNDLRHAATLVWPVSDCFLSYAVSSYKYFILFSRYCFLIRNINFLFVT